MSSHQKRILTSVARLLFVLIPLLTGCGVMDRFAQSPPANEPTAAATPAATSASKPLAANQVATVVHTAFHSLLPDRLQIPTIRVDTPVVELGWVATQSDNGRVLSEWQVADNAAGWHKNSVLLGDHGNLVMSGHNNIKGAVFRNLDQLKRNDKIVVWSGKQHLEYRVADVMIVPEKYASEQQRAANAQWIGQFKDDRLTLVSCWPRDDNTHRIIVIAHPLNQ